jgi:hypothetical protein
MQTGSQCVVAPGFLSGQTTFTWRTDKAIDVDDRTGYVSPIIEQELTQAVIAEMSSKGFEFVERPDGDPLVTEQSTDIEVALTLRTRRELISMTIGESPCVDTDCWERINPGSSTRVDMRTIGFLAADVFYAGEPIWRGWVERDLFPKDRDEAQAVISEAVPVLFESFPP